MAAQAEEGLETENRKTMSMIIAVSGTERMIRRILYPSAPFSEEKVKQVLRQQVHQTRMPEWNARKRGTWVKGTRYIHTGTGEVRDDPPSKRARESNERMTGRERKKKKNRARDQKRV